MRSSGLALFLATFLAGCGLPTAPRAQSFEFLAGHIDLARGPDGNTVILDAPEGSIVVDTGRHPEHAAAILERISGAENGLAAIINTHWHLDHTTGNRDIRAAYPDAQVIATGAGEGALAGFLSSGILRARAMAADPGADPRARETAQRMLDSVDDRASFLPARAIERGETRTMAGLRLEFHVAPAAVTEADLWLTVPDAELAVVGDLVVAQAPFFDTGCEEGWRKALDDIAAARWTTLIPGHGDLMDRAAFSRWRAAFDRFLDCGASDAEPKACAERWLADAKGFYGEAERESVRDLIVYYVGEVLRAPLNKRMAYCRSGG